MKLSSFLKKILCLEMCVMFALCGCNTSNKNTGDNSPEFNIDKNAVPVDYAKSEYYNGGIHQYNKNETNDYFIKDGKSKYVILVPDKFDAIIQNAANELTKLLFESTNTRISVLRESDCPENVNYISLGDTIKSSDNNIIVNKNRVNTHGFIIKTFNKNIFIKSGGANFGVLWGVYEFLTQTIDYICVAYDTYTLDTNKKDIKLYDFDIIDSPDFELRLANNGVIYMNPDRARKLRFLVPEREVYIAPSTPYHNYFAFVPEENKKVHPKWFSDDGSQLCLTAHGDKKEYESLVETMVDSLKKVIDEDPDKKIVTVTQEDFDTWCTCPTCKKLYEKYGTDAASNIHFINDVAERIETWLNKERGGREVVISIFAYYKTINAPVKRTDNNEYEPIDDTVICRDNVAVLFAPINANFNYGFNDEHNNLTMDQINQWKKVCNKFGYWGYTTCFRDYLVLYDSFSTSQSIYRTLLENFTPVWIFDQGQHDNSNHTAFTHFKMFLNSQLQWDVNKDYNVLKKTFFDNYFGPASEIMQEFYESYRLHVFNIQQKYDIGRGIFEKILKVEYFPYGTLKQWMKILDRAYETLECCKESETYKKFYDHINLESISVRYAILKLYEGRMLPSEFTKMKSEFRKDCAYHNISNIRENVSIDEFFN